MKQNSTNCLLKLIFAISTFLLPILSFAADGDSRFPLVLSPPDTDASVNFLANIFGIVDGVLHGGGSQIMGQMFGVFNAGALVLGGIIIIYFTLVSTLNTAHEGEFLGKRWKSIWIPIRAVIGIGLLLPKATGYSALQIFVMWITVQGVGLADSVWNAALSYLQGGGVIVQQALIPNEKIAIASGNVLKSTTCLFALQEALRVGADKARARGEKDIPTIPYITTNVIPISSGSTCGIPNGPPCVSLPDFHDADDPNIQKLTGICGQITWNKIDERVISAKTGLDGTALKNLALSRQIAVQQILIDMSGPGQLVAKNWLHLDTPTGVKAPDPLAVNKLLSPRLLINTAEDYQGIELPAQRILTQSPNVKRKFFDDAKAQGWISAGSYFKDLVDVNVQVQGVTADTPNVDPQNAIGSLAKNLKDKLPAFAQKVSDVDIPTAIAAIFTNTGSSSLDYYLKDSDTLKTDENYGGRQKYTPPKHSLNFGGGFINEAIKLLLGFITPLIEVFDAFDNLLDAQSTNANPLVLIALMGNNLISFVTQFWIHAAIGVGGLSIAVAFIPCMQAATALQTLINTLFTFLWPLLAACLISGLVMSYYLPIIPFVLFLFGAIGWFVAVIEAMIAAPIIALGVAYPEGQHELFGRSEPGIMLILNVFLTPALMIIGFVVGIILSYVGIWLLNIGFRHAFEFATSISSDIFVYIFSAFARIIVYTIIAIYIYQESFTPVHRLRDQVLNFIGGPGSNLGAEFKQAAGHIQGDARGGAQSLSGVMEPSKTPKGGDDKDAGGQQPTATAAPAGSSTGNSPKMQPAGLQMGNSSSGGGGSSPSGSSKSGGTPDSPSSGGTSGSSGSEGTSGSSSPGGGSSGGGLPV